MNRREFLARLGALAAASQVVDLTEIGGAVDYSFGNRFITTGVYQAALHPEDGVYAYCALQLLVERQERQERDPAWIAAISSAV